MIHDIEVDELHARPTARLCNLIISECLAHGHTGIRLADGGVREGMEIIAVRFLVEGDWKDVMQIPAEAGALVLAHLRSMCDVDPVHSPGQEGSFRVRGGGFEASVVASFVKADSGGEEVELRLTPH